MKNFDFDEWATLYKVNPELFEQKRRALIQEAIASAPADHQLKLRLLQAEVELIRATANSEIEGVQQIMLMLQSQVEHLEDSLRRLTSKM